MWFAVSPNIIANQYIRAGIARKAIARLQPMKLVKMPIEKIPNRAPIQLIDPIHEACSIVIEPVFSGESSDIKYNRAGDTHPTVQPCENIIKFAEITINYSSKNETIWHFKHTPDKTA